jgi:hypothetical protein
MTNPQFANVGKSAVYELPASQGKAWSGYLLPQGTPATADPISTQDAYSKVAGHYLFASRRPAALGSDPIGFAAALYKALANLKNRTFVGRAVAWLRLDDSGALTKIAPYLRFTQGLGNLWVNQVNCNVGLGDNLTFTVASQTTLGYNDGSRLLQVYTQSQGLVSFTSLTLDQSGLAITPNGSYYQAFIALLGDQNGCFAMNATLGMPQARKFFDPGLQYLYVAAQPNTPPGRISYPIFRDSSATRALKGAIDPLDTRNEGLADADLTAGLIRSGFTFSDPAALPSTLTTVEGKPVSLWPRGGAGSVGSLVPHAGGLGFVAYKNAAGGTIYQFAPFGDFALSVDGVPAGTPEQRLLPGLFGSEYLTFTTMPAGAPSPDLLRWRPCQPAYAPVYPFQSVSLNNPSSGALVARLTTSIPVPGAAGFPARTAWATIVAGQGSAAINYSAQPAGAPLYAPDGIKPNSIAAATAADILGSAPPLAALPTPAGFAVPVVPYTGIAAPVSGAEAGRFESEILSPTRKALITPHTTAALRAHRVAAQLSATAVETKTATTPQGLLAEVPKNGHGNYRKVTLAVPSDSQTMPDFAFCSLTEALTDALQTNQLFLVAVNNKNLGTSVSWCPGQPRTDCEEGDEAQFLNSIDIAGWTFVANIGADALPTDYRNVLIMKFCDGSLRDRLKNPNQWSSPADFSQLAGTGTIDGAFASLALTGLATWLTDFVDAGIAKADGTDSSQAALYKNFKAIVTDNNWNGFIVLNADLPLSALPAQIAGIGAGIDLERFVGHHFGSSVSRIKANGDALSIDGVSSLFGLIDYVDPTYAQNIASGGRADNPIPIPTKNGYGFTVLQLQVLFAQAKLKIFRSRIQLSMDALFSSPIQSTTFDGRAQTIPALVLDGSALTQNGQTVYVYEQTRSYVFIPNSSAVNAIGVSRVQFNTLNADPGGRVNSRFLLWGSFDFTLMMQSGGDGQAQPVPFDFLSFGSVSPAQGETEGTLGRGLSFANLQIQMGYAEATPQVVDFAFDPGNLAFDVAASAPRQKSLFNGFALQVTDFIAAPADKTPADYGFLPVLPQGVSIDRLKGPWYGIKYKLDMGTPGALASAAGFSSSFATIWAPASLRGDGFPQIFAGLSLPGAAPAASAFSLQGVVKLSTGPIKLSYAPAADTTDSFYTLALEDIGIKILGIVKLPPSTTIRFFLFGDPAGKGSLGWWASLIADDAAKYFDKSDREVAA